MIFWNKLRAWTLQHKHLSGFLIILILIVFGSLIASISLISLNDARTSTSTISPLSSNRGLGLDLGLGAQQESFLQNYTEPASGGAEVEVKEANFTIKSENAEDEVRIVREISARYEGYIERSNKSETNTILRISMTVRIPTDSFEQFIDELQNFDVKNYTINNYRIPIQRELDELDILERALGDYSKIRKEINSVPIGEEKINLLMNITKSELELKRLEKTFGRSLSGKERQGELATIRVSLEQKLKAELWPENIDNKFRDGFQRALESILDSIVSISTGSIALFFQVIQWIIYALTVSIPVLFIYKILKHLYDRFWPKESSKDNANKVG